MEKKYFEYEVSSIFSKQARCLKANVVDCTEEKALKNAEKFKKLINLVDAIWDEYGKSKKTRHGRQYSTI